MSFVPGGVSVTVPDEKVAAITQSLTDIQATPLATRKRFQKLAGQINFVAGLIAPIRPFLSPLWVACAPGRSTGSSSSAPRAKRRRLPAHLVHTVRFREALWWLQAFF